MEIKKIKIEDVEYELYATGDVSGNVITDTYMTKVNPTGSGSVSINRKADTEIGNCSVAIGNETEASGDVSIATGNQTIASGDRSIATGYQTTASGSQSTAMGRYTTASGAQSFATGYSTTASGSYSFTMGRYTTASGSYSVASGVYSKVTGSSSVAMGYNTTAQSYQGVFGKYNAITLSPNAEGQNTDNTDGVFVVGCGVSTATKNAFRITSGGKCYGTTAFGASGADFAELFEWADGNPNNEDRRGLFVALDGEKIKIANEGDDYIGVISGAQAFIGNSASEEWQGKYLTDVFGEKLLQEVEVPEVVDEATGEVIAPATTTTQFIVNPEYDQDQEYTMRENRKEWGIVGLLGQIVMIDDGTCVVGGRVKPSVNGIGTASDNGYRVMKRIDENHIKVLVK